MLPGESEVHPQDVQVATSLTPQIQLKTPILSAAMDTVTEARLAIALAQLGGLGVLHRNFDPQAQAQEVLRVKKYEGGMVVRPITVNPDQTLGELIDLAQMHGVSGFPVVRQDALVGVVTGRDFRFEQDRSKKINELMTPKDRLVVAREGVQMEEARRLLNENRIEKLPIVDDQFNLKGLITVKDLEKARRYPNASKDKLGRLLVGAAIGSGDHELERATELVAAEVDVLVVDTAHGHAKSVQETVKKCAQKYPEVPIIAGNVATEAGARALIKAGAQAIKVGIGPGSICTTRMVAGIGVPQWTAVREAVKAARPAKIPVIADGGIKFSGDAVKALAAGASTVMIGSMFAGTEEAPGDLILYQGRSYKSYRGMGSLSAMQRGSSERYFQGDVPVNKLVPEGIEGRVPYRGRLADVLHQIVGGIRAGMGYVGAANVSELWDKAQFVQISAQGLKESHAHGVVITQEAPNYRVE